MSKLGLLLDSSLHKGLIDEKLKTFIIELSDHYNKILAQSPNPQKNQQLFEQLITLVLENIKEPPTFSIFHRSVRSPFDYYEFGRNFMRPFIDFTQSRVTGLNSIAAIQNQLKNKENVILLSNHQTEPDPQIISLLLEEMAPKLVEDMVFVAGHRVTTDPMAIPMSLGQNLLCVYSKKYIDHPPEEKEKKISHNQRTMQKMKELLNEGGYCIFVAPSGGRDRLNSEGEIEVAPFDPQSVELFWLMGQQAVRPTHFYPLALQTYPVMPPPKHVEKEVGEKRIMNISPVYMSVGEEIVKDAFAFENVDKKTQRLLRADYVHDKVCEMYREFPK